MDDVAISQQFRQGDVTAFARLVSAHQVAAARTAHLIVLERAVAEDVVSQAFETAWTRRRQLRAGHPFKPWFFTIVVNTALTARARRRREVSLDELLAEHAAPDAWAVLHEPDATAMDRERRRAVRHCLALLSDAHCQVLVLKFFQEFTQEEIAAIVGCPIGTVKSRLARAEEALKTLLQHHYPWLADERNGATTPAPEQRIRP